MTLDRSPPPAPPARTDSSSSRKRSVSPNRRIRRSTEAAGVLEGQVEVRRHARRRGDDSRPGPAASRRAAGSSPGPGPCPSTAASSGSSVSSSRRSPRSLPYEVEFSLTSTSSRTPCSASQAASASTSAAGGRRTQPRKAGMAQKVQRRSQPEASFSGAGGPSPSRRRSGRGPDGRRDALGQVGPGMSAAVAAARPPDGPPGRAAAGCAGPAARAATCASPASIVCSRAEMSA